MSIKTAYLNALRKATLRRFDVLYFAVDLHDTVFKANYENGGYEFYNEDAKNALQLISSSPYHVLILWSSAIDSEKEKIVKFLEQYNIRVDFFNENPMEKNTEYADFSQKFYFSVLIDDKAGFDPDYDWYELSREIEKQFSHPFYIR